MCGYVLIPVVPNGNISITHPACIMLIGKRLGLIDKCKFIHYATETPDEFAGVAINLGYLVQVPVRGNDVSIGI